MLTASDRHTLASAKANFTIAINRGVQPRRRDIYVRKNGKTVYQPGMTDRKALSVIQADNRVRVKSRATNPEGGHTRSSRGLSKRLRPKKVREKATQFLGLRIWKHSHGYFENDLDRTRYEQRQIITLHKNTRKGQAAAFKEEMLTGDFVYLCHGNKVQLLGQITSGLLKATARWPERKYRVVEKCQRRNSRFDGRQKKWTPNYNSTCALVPTNDLLDFEQSILLPFFGLRLTDLQAQAPEEPITPQEDEALSSLPKKKYDEARQKLVRHKRLEIIVVRNKKLVEDAKKHFKSKHGTLFCEACGFNFEQEYGARGIDFIEAHHSTPFAHIRAGARLKISDLNMVCANCHRMLHRPPWATVLQLKRERATR
jgi:hypothetical protein